MEDTEKDNKKSVPAEKNLKKPKGRSVTGKPLDGIDIRPQLKDKDAARSAANEETDSLTDSPLDEVLDFTARRKRARQARKLKTKLARARKIAQRRMAPQSKLEVRAQRAARGIIKKRLAARRGTPYSELSVAEKINVDKRAAKKVELIKKIAKRLLPKVRRAEMERLASFRSGKPLKNLAAKNEELANIINNLDDRSDIEIVNIIESTIRDLNESNSPLGPTLRGMLNTVISEDASMGTLFKKSQKTGIPFSILGEVFERGMFLWEEDDTKTQEQYAFSRVNSYIAKGKAWHLDSDLRESRTVDNSIDKTFTSLVTNNETIWENIAKTTPSTEKRKKIEIVDRNTSAGENLNRHGQIKKKIIDEACWDTHKQVGMKKKGNKMVPNCVPKEEAEQIDEISKKTATSYRNKAFNQYMKATHGPENWNTMADKARNKAVSRLRGAELADKKLGTSAMNRKARVMATEDAEQVDEISKTTLKSYLDKAPGDIQKIAKKSKFDTLVKSAHKSNKRMQGMGRAMKKVYEADCDHTNDCSCDSPSKRELGTKSLTKKYKKDTPGESIKEDITRRGDFKLVKVRTPDGRTVWRKVKKEIDVERNPE